MDKTGRLELDATALPENVYLALAALVGSFLTFLLGLVQSKRQGINAFTAAQIADGAQIRKDLMEENERLRDRVSELEQRVDELSMTVITTRQTLQIAELALSRHLEKCKGEADDTSG